MLQALWLFDFSVEIQIRNILRALSSLHRRCCKKMPLEMHREVPLGINDDFRGVDFRCAICFAPRGAAAGRLRLRAPPGMDLWL